jgi:hypothetical protein
MGNHIKKCNNLTTITIRNVPTELKEFICEFAKKNDTKSTQLCRQILMDFKRRHMPKS